MPKTNFRTGIFNRTSETCFSAFKISRENPEITERFNIIIAGVEIGNGFSELNDPIDQAERFEAQQELLKAGDKRSDDA